MYIDSLGGVTSDLISLALDASSLRHEIIANNVANVSTPGYAAKHYAFEEVMNQFKIETTGLVDMNRLERDLPIIQEQLASTDAIQARTDPTVKLDFEMVDTAKNVLFYKSLLEASSKRGAILKLAISGGKNGG